MRHMSSRVFGIMMLLLSVTALLLIAIIILAVNTADDDLSRSEEIPTGIDSDATLWAEYGQTLTIIAIQENATYQAQTATAEAATPTPNP